MAGVARRRRREGAVVKWLEWFSHRDTDPWWLTPAAVAVCVVAFVLTYGLISGVWWS